MTEAEIQKELYKRFKAEYPLYIKSFQASLNGVNLSAFGKRRFQIINSLKAQGLCVGQADVFIAIPRDGYHGKYVELKTQTGKVSDDQIQFGDAMKRQGYDFEVAYGIEQAWSSIKTYVDCAE